MRYVIAVLLLASSIVQAADQPKLSSIPVPPPGTRLEPWTNGRYIIRDTTGRQAGTLEPYVNGWIIRDISGRETGRIQR